MKQLADALIHAATYLTLREDDDEDRLAQDVAVLERIGALLEFATGEELAALHEAARRARDEALVASKKDGKLLEAFEHWIELFEPEKEEEE